MFDYKHEYKVNISKITDEDGRCWLIEVPELPGCMSDGATMPEALESINGAIDAWIETAREAGISIPSPKKQLRNKI